VVSPLAFLLQNSLLVPSLECDVFTAKQILEKCWERNTDLLKIFTDFQQAYDSIDRAMIGYIMREFGTLPEKLVRLVEPTLENTISCVKLLMETGSF
jgi:hypothetical protein